MSGASTFHSKDPFLNDLLSEIKAGKIQLPDFQRGWVWDDDHIRSLIASITLSYPIGALMTLESGGDGVRFKPRAIEGVVLKGDVEPDLLILDGQQRLTSLYLALASGDPVPTRDSKSKEIERVYYLDMQMCLDSEADRLDAVVSLPPSRIVTRDFGRSVELDLSEPEKEYRCRYFPLHLMFDPVARSEWEDNFRTSHDYAREQVEFLSRFRREIADPLQKYKVPVIALKRDTPKEAVCQVFERVNTGGVSLTVFELMTATFAADDFQLMEDWAERESRLQEHDVLCNFSGTDFLQAVTLLASYKKSRFYGAAVSVKRRDVLRLTLDEYRDNAAQVEDGLIRASRFLDRQRIFEAKNLPYGSQLVPLGAICAFLGREFEADRVKEQLAHWYWSGVLGELYGGANESRMAQDIQDVCGWILEQGEPPRTIQDGSFSPTRLLSLQTRQSAAYKGLYALMIQHGAHDFVSGDPITHSTGFSLPVEIHHIFPKKWCKNNGLPQRKWNCVVNKAPLTSMTNRVLGSQAPSQYLRRITGEQVSENRLHRILQTHLIRPSFLEQDRFEDFIIDRATSLLDAIERATGWTVPGRDSEETINAFGCSLEKEQRATTA